MEIIPLLIDQVSIVQNFLIEKINESYKTDKLSSRDIRLLTESLISIERVLNIETLEPHDKVLLEKTYRFGNDTIHDRLNYFSSYYYSYQNISKGNINDQQNSFIMINAETSTMLTTIFGFNRNICRIGGSTDDYYVERMPRIFWALEYIYKNNLSEIYLPALYTLINLCQSLTEYLNSKDTQYQKQALELLKTADTLLDKFYTLDEGKLIIEQNVQLEVFFKTQKNKTNEALASETPFLTTEILELPNIKTEHQLRILTSLAQNNPKNFIELFEKNLNQITEDIYSAADGLNNFLFLQSLAFYIVLNNIPDKFELKLNPLNQKKINLDEQLEFIFKQYKNSKTEVVSEDELGLLLSYNDDTLREKVSKIILGVDEHILERERKKPHGVFEIADMEIPIKLNNERFFLCMPFKSGLEIPSKTVPENISYQIFRPFIHFDKTVVIFITAKRCSQNLMNYIKRMQDKLGWPIAVIENEELAKLLKVNGELN